MQHEDTATTEKEARKTIDLCGAQRHTNRCMRERGHDGQHECLVIGRTEPVRWDD